MASLDIWNPATEERLATLEADTPESLSEKLNRARAAQPKWAALPFAKRAACVEAFKEALVSQSESLAKTLTQEMGKPLSQARGEIRATPARIDFFLEEVEAKMQTERIRDAGKMQERISYEPLGVIANISAWNYPYFVGVNVFIPALLTGNAVLYKPSEHATMTGQAIQALMTEAGVPEGIFQTVIGGGNVGAELLAQAIDGVFFTGSYGTGCKIAAAAAKRLIPVQLELGGKDPTYVCDDADPKAAAEALADGAFYNAGQSCCSVERIYVHESIYEAFVEAFVQTVNDFNIGDPLEEGTYIGPLFRKSQLDHLTKQVKDATDKGAQLLCGGQPLEQKGHYFAPTVLTQVDHDMEVMKEESFGPIIGIMSVKDDESAIQLMNDTRYGLTAGVYTASQERAEGIMSQLHAGSVYWNCCDRVSPRLPWSGRKDSGLGVTLSHLGIRPFLQPKGWHLVSPK